MNGRQEVFSCVQKNLNIKWAWEEVRLGQTTEESVSMNGPWDLVLRCAVECGQKGTSLGRFQAMCVCVPVW